MAVDRKALELRLQALVADFLDGLDREHGPTYDLGIAAIVAEVRYTLDDESPDAVRAQRGRAEAGYTPEPVHARTGVWYRCTDSRTWVQVGLLRKAIQLAEWESDDDEDG